MDWSLIVFAVAGAAPNVFAFPSEYNRVNVEKEKGNKKSNHVYPDWALSEFPAFDLVQNNQCDDRQNAGDCLKRGVTAGYLSITGGKPE